MKPKLVGERFQGHAVPLEVLTDFAALQEMLVETAKWKFRQEHPDRERIQRNFAKDIELQLVGIEDGSAVLVIALSFASLFPPENAKYFEQARTEIVNAIAESAQGRSPQMPPSLLSYFDRFGRSLRTGESIEFPHGDRPAALTPEVRKHLIHAAKVEVWTEELSLRAKIYEADQAHDSFEFELSDGTRAKAPLDDRYRDAVLDTFMGYRDSAFVVIQGVAQRDRSDRLKGFESIEHVTPLDPLDVTLRLEQISAIRDGWLNGTGRAPSKNRLEWLADAFDANFDSDLPLPYLYPTAEGGVQAEWSLNDWAVTLEIDLEKEQGEYQALNLKDQTCTELQISLADSGGWAQLNDALKQLESPKAEASKSEA